MHRQFLPILAVLALAGCGSDGDGDPSPDGVGDSGEGGIDAAGATLLGLVDVDTVPDPDGDVGGIDAVFLRLGSSERFGEVLSLLRPAPGTCEFTAYGDGTLTILSGTGAFGAEDSIDAGEAILFSSPAGTWLELTRDAEGGITYYGPDGLPGPMPTGLVVDIPGADFPAFAAVPVPRVVPLGDVTAGAGPLDGAVPTDTFRWTATNDPASLLAFDFATFGDDDNAGVAGSCTTRDDGEFRFPADALEEIGSVAGRDFSVQARRQIASVSRQGDALLLVLQGSTGSTGSSDR